MINANQITDTTPKQTLASFLKTATSEQVESLELTIDDAYSVEPKPNQRIKTIAKRMLTKRRTQIQRQKEQIERQIKRPSIEKQLEQIQQEKKELQDWKLSYIMVLLGILAFIANTSTNKKTSEQYQFDSTGKQNGITKIQEIVPSDWWWLWIGIVAIVIIIISLCVFIDTEVVCCGIKLKGIIPRKHDKLEERERERERERALIQLL